MSGIPDTVPDPRQGMYGTRPIFTEKPIPSDVHLDSEWVKVAFMVSDEDMRNKVDIENRFYSSASAKFTDTRLGCNIGINPRPQWTRYADIRSRGRGVHRTEVTIGNMSGNFGMGRAYSEAIDDNAQIIYMRFGVPRFNSLLDFLFKAYSLEHVVMARTGRAPSWFFKGASTVGMLATGVTFPFLTLTVFAGRALGWLMGRPTSKFFTMKEAMFFYWNTVTNLVNNHVVNIGLYPRVFDDSALKKQRLGRPYKLTNEHKEALHNLMPDFFRQSGDFDIRAVANKAQRLANQVFERDYEALENGDAFKYYGYLVRSDYKLNPNGGTYISTPKGRPTLSASVDYYLSPGNWSKLFRGYWEKLEDKEKSLLETDPREDKKAAPGEGKWLDGGGSYGQQLAEAAAAEWRDGSSFAVFRVDYTGSVQESFTNTTGESELAQTLNSTSTKVRETRFSVADGSLGKNAIGAIVSSVVEAGLGLIDGVTLGFAGLAAGLAGSGYIDIPHHWQSSNASLPQGSYTIQLISPYNNPISQMINIWIPFYMILAGGLPRSTGKQSYTSPYYCQIYDRGRLQSKLAMISSISITRGTSNLGFDVKGQALGLDITFNVQDLSSIMHIPISNGGALDFDVTMDDDNLTADYLATLAGMDIYSQIYALPKAQLKLAKSLLNLRQKATSPYYHAALFKNSVENGFINTITLGASGVISEAYSAAVRGNFGLVAREETR